MPKFLDLSLEHLAGVGLKRIEKRREVMELASLAHIIYAEIRKIHHHALPFDTLARVRGIYQLLNSFVSQLLEKEQIQFVTQFARMAYVCHKYGVPQSKQDWLYEFRKRGRGVLFQHKEVEEKYYELGIKALVELVEFICKSPVPADLQPIVPPANFYRLSAGRFAGRKASARVMLLADNEAAECFIGRDEDAPHREVFVKYGQAGINDAFSGTVAVIKRVWKSQVTVNLLQVEIDAAGHYYPRAFIVEPDALADVSAVAACFTPDGAHSKLHLLKKFLPVSFSPSLMIGNIANFFLDELMHRPTATFAELFPRTFLLDPLAFTAYTDEEVREIMQTCKRHFLTLKDVVARIFREHDILPENCYLEPSFYSEQYGLQGRLDVWYANAQTPQHSAIVELKSGKPFQPNRYGISSSHYVQALLYDLLIKSVYNQLDPRNFILYSRLETDQLRFAPVVRAIQHEAIQVRNEMVALEEQVAQLHQAEDPTPFFGQFTTAHFPKLRGFLAQDIRFFEKNWGDTTHLERLYFSRFAAFIAKEHQLAKTGIQGSDRVNGLASLWLNSLEEKNENFEIISHLKVAADGNKAGEEEALIFFEKNETFTNNLANFRAGDIAVLYPMQEGEQQTADVLHTQVFKCTILSITAQNVAVRLRSKQFNTAVFSDSRRLWTLEHDVLDHSFNAMYRGVFDFLQQPTSKRDLLLTLRAPRCPQEEQPCVADLLPDAAKMTDEQKQILQKAIAAPDYFLLWGPPGTGKTSVMLKNLVAYLMQFTEENILLLAYTNRAVDEICEAVEAVGGNIRSLYVRIGSRHSSHPTFHEQLLDSKIAQIRSRKELRAIIDQHRIFVATVASISSRQILLSLKKFDRVVVDEASQILEPILVGLLPQFERFILIGDHNQLPAVVTQAEPRTATTDAALQAIGLHNLRDSLFERLFLRCREQGWTQAYDMLSRQGRMHADIMDYPNRFFYDGKLGVLPPPKGIHQLHLLELRLPDDASPLERHLATHRLVYLPSEVDAESITGKTNRHEARQIAELVKAYFRLYEANKLPIHADTSIGIITPYRAQIAAIKQALEAEGIGYEQCSVDTVERYQGSARDIILLSLCVNKPQQLEFLVSLSTDGKVDRKLNVALTRARHHLVVVGNEMLMRQHEAYKNFVEYLVDHQTKWSMEESV